MVRQFELTVGMPTVNTVEFKSADGLVSCMIEELAPKFTEGLKLRSLAMSEGWFATVAWTALLPNPLWSAQTLIFVVPVTPVPAFSHSLRFVLTPPGDWEKAKVLAKSAPNSKKKPFGSFETSRSLIKAGC